MMLVFAFPASPGNTWSNIARPDAGPCQRRVRATRSVHDRQDSAAFPNRPINRTIISGNPSLRRRFIAAIPHAQAGHRAAAGRQAAGREYVLHPGAVMMIPLFDDGTVLMERQFRYPVGEVMLEFPPASSIPRRARCAAASASCSRKPATPRAGTT
jgi:hypothetical protein